MKLLKLAAILALAMCGCSGPDIVQMDLRDLSEARSKGVLHEGGWLPMFLPSSSREIRLRYDVDTNEVWVAFRPGGTSLEPFDTQCKKIAPGEAVLARQKPRSWWPDYLSAESATSKSPATHEYYKCSDGGFSALSKSGETSYYWFQPSESAGAG